MKINSFWRFHAPGLGVPHIQFATRKVVEALVLKQHGTRDIYRGRHTMLEWIPAQQPKLTMRVVSGNKRKRRVIATAQTDNVWCWPCSNLMHMQCALCSKACRAWHHDDGTTLSIGVLPLP